MTLLGQNPDLVAEWHPTKNGALTPARVGEKSDLLVWWRCSVDPTHEWQATVASRFLDGEGCPLCPEVILIPDETWSFADLKEHAESLGVDTEGKKSKKSLVAAIRYASGGEES